MIRMLASDIDHTLFSHQTYAIPEMNLKAADTLRSQGVELVLATARIYAGVRKLEAQLDMREKGGMIIASAGAELIDCRRGIRTVLHSLTLDQIKTLKQFSDAHPGVTLAVQQEDLMVADGYDASLDSDRTVVGIDFLVVGSDFFSYMTKPACMAGLTGDPQQLDEIEIQARAVLKDVTLTRSGPGFLDVTPQGVHKALALKQLCGRHGIPLQALAAIGDGNNDREMLAEAGLSFAPSNAVEAVKKQVDHVLGSCEEGAFAQAVAMILERNEKERAHGTV